MEKSHKNLQQTKSAGVGEILKRLSTNRATRPMAPKWDDAYIARFNAGYFDK